MGSGVRAGFGAGPAWRKERHIMVLLNGMPQSTEVMPSEPKPAIGVDGIPGARELALNKRQIRHTF